MHILTNETEGERRFQTGCRVRKTRRLGNYPLQTIVNMLKLCDIVESNIVKERIVIVKSTDEKSSGNRKREL